MQCVSAVIAALLFVASAAATNQISCYICNSESNASCGDPIQTGEDAHLKPQICSNELTNTAFNIYNAVSKGVSNILGVDKMSQANFACLKFAYTVKAGDVEKKVVQRACSVESANICDSLKEKNKETADFFCEECNTDACNGSSTIHTAVIVLVSALAFLLFSQ